MIQLGERIKEFRQRDGRTQEALANALGVTAQAVSRWEKGICYPDMGMIPSIANYFGVSIDELFGYDNERSKKIDALVERIADALVFFGNNFRNIRFVFGYYVQGVVSRCPVYDDILFVGVVLADDAEDSFLNSLFAIVGYGDYADLGAGHFFNTY